jgi:hypothetical protein
VQRISAREKAKMQHDEEWQDLVTGRSETLYQLYIMAELRLARKRARLLINEIDSIGMALKGRLIDGDTAVIWLAEANGLRFLQVGQEPLLSTDMISSNEAAAAALSLPS